MAYGIEGAYTREPVEPGEAAAFLRSLADRGFAGCNVTIPHKEAAFAAMDEVDPGAVAVGAVNTVWHEGGRLIGMNSRRDGVPAEPRRPGARLGPRDRPCCRTWRGRGRPRHRSRAEVTRSRDHYAGESIVLQGRSYRRRDPHRIRPAAWSALPALLPTPTCSSTPLLWA